MSEEPEKPGLDFIRQMVADDLASGKHESVVTRFPPEPNGYLHIGHAKAICLNFGLALEHGGKCRLRMDDTDPAKESYEYVDAIKHDIEWLGFRWDDVLFASDYFERLYAHAVALIKKGLAYVDSLDEAAVREYRGTITEPGKPSPYRDRSVEENLDLFARMRAGEFTDGEHVLRAKIDLRAANMKMRDPPIYRIRHATHYRQGDEWCVYPLYDFTHCLSDAFEGVTHSLCTLEFQDNRELYDWVLDHTDEPARPEQTEFARLSLEYTVMSKRKLLQLVEEGHVAGWDDPRMPTISGLRRRGLTPESIRKFCDRIGVAKHNSEVELALLEHTVREDLNERCPRVMGVLRPLKLVIENHPGTVEQLDASYWPHDIPKEGSRKVPFSRELYIEREDFAESPPKKWHRLAPGAEVRLRYAYVVKCTGVVKNDSGEVVELRGTYDADTLDAPPADGRRVRGTIHWVSANESVECEARLYDRLFSVERLGADGVDFLEQLNPDSLEVVKGARVEPSLLSAAPGDRWQLERTGFFHVDPDSKPGALIFNRTVALRDSWSKLAAKAPSAARAKPPPPKAPESNQAVARKRQPELSDEAKALVARHDIGEEEARILSEHEELKRLLDSGLSSTGNAAGLVALLVNDVRRELKKDTELLFGGSKLAELVNLVDEGTISGRTAKDVFAEMARTGARPKDVVERQGLTQMSDVAELESAVDDVVSKSADLVSRYRAGNRNLLGALVGQVMKATRGKANPRAVNELLQKKLG